MLSMAATTLIWVINMCNVPVYFIGINSTGQYLAYPVERIDDNPVASKIFVELVHSKDKDMKKIEMSDHMKSECI